MKEFFDRTAKGADRGELDKELVHTVACTSDVTRDEKTATIRKLLKAGASPDAMLKGSPPSARRCALGLALKNNLPDAVKLLLDAGADVGTLSIHDMAANAGADIVLAHMAEKNLLDKHEKIAGMLRLQSIRFLGKQKPKAEIRGRTPD
jgi:hypothetical protein